MGTNDPTTRKFTVLKPPETYGGGQDPHTVLAPVKKKRIYIVTNFVRIFYTYIMLPTECLVHAVF
jgi:hypothetical protein